MANYKVVDSEFLDAGMTQIANAIREKSGTSGNLAFPNAMASAISNIQAGGGSDGADAWAAFIEGSSTEVSSNATNVGANVFQGSTYLTTVNLPLAKTIGRNAFKDCTNLESVNTPSATSINDYAFKNCTALTTINAPLLTIPGIEAFRYNESLESVNFPLVTRSNNWTFLGCTSLTRAILPKATVFEQGSFEDCTSLTIADCSSATVIGQGAFSDCKSLKAVIIRPVNTKTGVFARCTLNNADAFYNCAHITGYAHEIYNPDGLKDGYIYVPAELVSYYQSATNWSTLGADRFRALEDYTVDGTATGALDESKI